MLLWSTFCIYIICQTWEVFKYFLLKQYIGVIFDFEPENERDQTDHYYLILKQANFQGLVIDPAPQIQRGHYDI